MVVEHGNTRGERHVLRNRPRPILNKGAWPQRPQVFGASCTCAHTVRETVSNFCMVVEPDERNFFKVDHAPCPGQKVLTPTRMLTRDPFAPANRLVFIPVAIEKLLSRQLRNQRTRNGVRSIAPPPVFCHPGQ